MHNVCVEVIIITTITIMVVAFCLLFRRIRQVKLDRERISTKKEMKRGRYMMIMIRSASAYYIFIIFFAITTTAMYVCIYCTLKYCVKKLHY